MPFYPTDFCRICNGYLLNICRNTALNSKALFCGHLYDTILTFIFSVPWLIQGERKELCFIDHTTKKKTTSIAMSIVVLKYW